MRLSIHEPQAPAHAILKSQKKLLAARLRAIGV